MYNVWESYDDFMTWEHSLHFGPFVTDHLWIPIRKGQRFRLAEASCGTNGQFSVVLDSLPLMNARVTCSKIFDQSYE